MKGESALLKGKGGGEGECLVLLVKHWSNQPPYLIINHSASKVSMILLNAVLRANLDGS